MLGREEGFFGFKAAKACKSCKSRQELSNECLFANVGVDTAENGPLKVCQKLARRCQELEKKKKN